MKFRFLMLVAAAAMVACATDKSDSTQAEAANGGNGVEMYFHPIGNNTSYDSNAEFDTLSYVVGVNYAMAMQGLYLEGGLDRDIFIANFNNAVRVKDIDCEGMYRDIISNREFQDACYAPYNRTKQRQSFAKRHNPDTVMVAPVLFNEEFNSETTSAILGRHMANQLRIMNLPVNLYWVEEAFEDVKHVDNVAKADSLLDISVMEMVDMYRGYIPSKVSNTMKEQSEAWLANVAKQKDVVELCEEGMESPIYYRIDKAGSDRRPVDMRDSITIDYTLYSCHGILIESKDERIASIERQIARAERSEELDDESRELFVSNLKSQLELSKDVSTTLGGFFQNVISKCLPNIGEGGMITIWMPASYAPSLAISSRGLAYPNEGIVINISLQRVTPVAEQIKKMPTPISKGDMLHPKVSDKVVKMGGRPTHLTPKGEGPVTITPVKSAR